MPPFPFLPQNNLKPLLQAGGTLITVNRRTARFFAADYAAAKRLEGVGVWETPDILPYSGWLRRWLDSGYLAARTSQLESLPLLIERHQQRLVWEGIIEQTGRAMGLTRVSEAAETAMQAWEIVQSWRISLDALREEAVEDAAVFLDWADQYGQLCTENGWLDPAGLAQWIVSGLLEGSLPVPHQLILAGFDELSPQQSRLFGVLAEKGCSVCLLEPSGQADTAVCIGLPDREAEALAAARWIRSSLEANPDGRIGLVVPDLQSRRHEIRRLLDSVLHPETLLPDDLAAQRAFNVSLGALLPECPLVRSALLILEAADGSLSFERAGELLRSPFSAGSDSEASQRAGLDAAMRRAGSLHVELRDLLEAARTGGPFGPAPVLADSLTSFLTAVAGLPARQPPSRWVQSLQELLQAMGWPGERSLSSAEYQTVLSWREVLGRLAELDRFTGRLSFQQALEHLHKLAAEAVFQPSQPDLPVQVLGLLEPAGERFDSLWILGMHSEAWPPKPEPNPLLPASAQRRLETPHASAQRELGFARQVTGRLLDSASSIVISYPQVEDDRRLFLSPLFSELPSVDSKQLSAGISPDYWQVIMDSGCTETLVDEYGPQLEDQGETGGGTGLIKAQADCPFRAFAVYRLGVEALPRPELGLDAAERGQLVHSALQQVWKRLGQREALLRLGEDEKDDIVRAAAQRAVAAMARRKPRTFTPRFKDLESGRLQEVLREWLDVESGRPPFAVQGLERRQSVRLPGLALNISTDRIDRLADGRILILDYKTGRQRLKDWFGERIPEPQLPLYALASQEEVAGVAFALVRKGDCRFLGLAAEDSIVPGAVPIDRADAAAGLSSWSDLLHHWREAIDGLSREIQEGFASVKPNPAASACTFCDLLPLCRRDELITMDSGREESPEYAAE